MSQFDDSTSVKTVIAEEDQRNCEDQIDDSIQSDNVQLTNAHPISGQNCMAEPPHREEDGTYVFNNTGNVKESDDTGDTDSGDSHTEDENAPFYENAEQLFRKLSAENRRRHRNINDDELPDTVSLLHGKNGAKIYLIGTAHFSKESCEDVRKVICEAMPDVVMIELCRSRTDLLMHDEEKLLELAGDVSFGKITNQIKHKGLISGLMTFLLLHMSAHITKQLGMAPGGEFRAAYKEFRKIPGCRLHFGDRAVEVTLQRAFSTFSIWQKLKFAVCVLKDLGPIKPDDIEKLKEKDMLEQALEDMMGEFPELTNVFLSERDTYLAHSIQKVAANQIVTERETVPPVVVAVVGLGHAAGIRDRFSEEISDDQISELMKVPTPSRLSRMVKFLIKVLLCGAVGYGVLKVCMWGGTFLMGAYSWFSNLILEPEKSITGNGGTEL